MNFTSIGKCLNWNNESGHTLIEAVTALAVLALLTGLASAGFSGPMSHLRLNHAVRAFASDLRWARQLAIAEGRPVQLVLDTEAERYRVERIDSPGVPVQGVHDLRDRAQGYGGIDLVGSTGGDHLVFQPNGLTADWTTVTLRNDRGEERSVSLILTGRVRIK